MGLLGTEIVARVTLLGTFHRELYRTLCRELALRGFTAPFDSWEQWSVVIEPRAALPLLVAASLGVGGCTLGTKPPETAALAPAIDPRQQEIDERKEHILQQLATCESGAWGPSASPIYGGRGAYHGRFQFTLRTFINYTRKRDGVEITTKEAAEYTQDYNKAASLTWYMLHDLQEPWHWPLCTRKLGIAAKVAQIKQL